METSVLAYLWPIIQTGVILVGIGIAFGVLRNTVTSQGERFMEFKREVDDRIDKVDGRLDKMGDVMVALARQEERYNNMAATLLAQGQRIDSTATLINGRLEAINNIVSGHTSQLNQITSRQTKLA